MKSIKFAAKSKRFQMVSIGDILYHWPLSGGSFRAGVSKWVVTEELMVNIVTGIPWIYYIKSLGRGRKRTVTRNYIGAALETGRLIL